MATTQRKYIDSHWLIFAVQGVVGLIFGWITLFSASVDLSYLISIVGVFLLALGILELFNVLHRQTQRQGWIVALVIAVVDTVVAMALLLTMQENAVWHLSVLAAYTCARGIFELLVGFRHPDDLTDRFIWVVCGICGVVMGIVIFNSGALSTTEFVRFFGAYMMILGLSGLIYGVHNRDQKLLDTSVRSTAARKGHSTQSKKKGKK